MTISTKTLREALDKIQNALHDAYQNAGQECCGHGQGGECCGNAEPVWDAADQKIMDVLGPIQKMLSDALPLFEAQAAEIERLHEALRWTAGTLRAACALAGPISPRSPFVYGDETLSLKQILAVVDAALQGELK